MLVGGWVEGLYIATQLIKSNDQMKPDNPLIKRIVDQKLSLDIVLKLLNEYKEDKDVASVLKDMEMLQQVYNKIDITTTNIQAKEDKSTNITTVDSDSKINISLDTFKELQQKVKDLRTRYINK